MKNEEGSTQTIIGMTPFLVLQLCQRLPHSILIQCACGSFLCFWWLCCCVAWFCVFVLLLFYYAVTGSSTWRQVIWSGRFFYYAFFFFLCAGGGGGGIITYPLLQPQDSPCLYNVCVCVLLLPLLSLRRNSQASIQCVPALCTCDVHMWLVTVPSCWFQALLLTFTIAFGILIVVHPWSLPFFPFPVLTIHTWWHDLSPFFWSPVCVLYTCVLQVFLTLLYSSYCYLPSDKTVSVVCMLYGCVPFHLLPVIITLPSPSITLWQVDLRFEDGEGGLRLLEVGDRQWAGFPGVDTTTMVDIHYLTCIPNLFGRFLRQPSWFPVLIVCAVCVLLLAVVLITYYFAFVLFTTIWTSLCSLCSDWAIEHSSLAVGV